MNAGYRGGGKGDLAEMVAATGLLSANAMTNTAKSLITDFMM
jgi:hypothetical protein